MYLKYSNSENNMGKKPELIKASQSGSIVQLKNSDS